MYAACVQPDKARPVRVGFRFTILIGSAIMSKVICVKIAGIIAEYDPLHAGHIHHLRETRTRTGADRIVCALGGAFTQRGDAALFDKYARAEMALRAGADAVVELPEVWACRPAQLFARGGVMILDALGADCLSFGCETEDMDALYAALDLCSRRDGAYAAALHKNLGEGKSYPRALSEAAGSVNPELAPLLEGPNFILALEYLSAIRELNSGMIPCAVKRTSPYHAEKASPASASAVRQMLSERRLDEACKALPEGVAEVYRREYPDGLSRPEMLDAFVLSTVRDLDVSSFSSPDGSEGLINRLVSRSRTSASAEELVQAVKCKRYTHARIRRLVTDACLRLPMPPGRPKYIRLLGVRKDAPNLPGELYRRSGGLLTADAQALKNDPVFQAECRATDLWGLGTARARYRRAGREFTQRFICL